MKKLILQIIVSILGIWLAYNFVGGLHLKILTSSKIFNFQITKIWQLIILIGIFLGLINFFIKPIFKIITLPLHFLTLGISNILINLGIIWFLDWYFKELKFDGFLPLFLTTILISVLNLIIIRK